MNRLTHQTWELYYITENKTFHEVARIFEQDEYWLLEELVRLGIKIKEFTEELWILLRLDMNLSFDQMGEYFGKNGGWISNERIRLNIPPDNRNIHNRNSSYTSTAELEKKLRKERREREKEENQFKHEYNALQSEHNQLKEDNAELQEAYERLSQTYKELKNRPIQTQTVIQNPDVDKETIRQQEAKIEALKETIRMFAGAS